MFTVQMIDGTPDAKVAESLKNELLKPHIEAYEEEYKQRITPVLESMSNPRFSYRAIESDIRTRAAQAALSTKVREAITTSQMSATVALTMVHEIFTDYATWPAIYRQLAEMETSNSIDEVYPEEWMDDMPVPVAETEPAPESRVAAGFVRIRNYEYARELVISKRLFDRDKVGQAKRAARNFGQRYPQAIDKAFVFAFFRGGQTSNLIGNGGTIPQTNLAGQNPTSGFNTSPGPITPQRLEDALVAPAFFVDPFNLEIVIDFDTVFVDSFDRLKAKRYLTSMYNPIVGPAPGDTTGAPGPFTTNILNGEFKIAYSPYVKKARAPLAGAGVGFPWATLKAGNGVVVQMVHELEIEQEAPNAGKSHEERAYRWQGVLEFGTGPRNLRLVYYGN